MAFTPSKLQVVDTNIKEIFISKEIWQDFLHIPETSSGVFAVYKMSKLATDVIKLVKENNQNAINMN